MNPFSDPDVMGCDMGASSRAGYFESQGSSDGLGPDFEQRVITALKASEDRSYRVTSRELQASVNGAFNEGFKAGEAHARSVSSVEGARGDLVSTMLGVIMGAAGTVIAIASWHALFN